MRAWLAGLVVSALAVAGSDAVLAQQSTSFKLTESTFNSGGHPGPGANPTSVSNRLTLGSIGDGPSASLGMSASFYLEGNFVSAYPPPGETLNLGFALPTANKQTLTWTAERSAGDYNLYRAAVTSLSGLGYGLCSQQNLSGPTVIDATVPSIGQGFFYLVTVENRLNEEGTKGFASSGAERTGTQCP